MQPLLNIHLPDTDLCKCMYSRIQNIYKEHWSGMYVCHLDIHSSQTPQSQNTERKRCQNIHLLFLGQTLIVIFEPKMTLNTGWALKFDFNAISYPAHSWMTTWWRLGFEISVVLCTINIRKFKIIFRQQL